MNKKLISKKTLKYLFIISGFIPAHYLLLWAVVFLFGFVSGFEKRTENNRDYDALGIGFMSEYRFAVMQWIYIDRENKKIFELDVTNDELVEFK